MTDQQGQPGLSEAQRQEINQIVAHAIATALAQLPQQHQPQNLPQPPPVNANTGALPNDTRWRPEEIGFFDPELDSSHGIEDCVLVGNNTY